MIPTEVSDPYDVACEYMTSACAVRGLDGWLVWIWTRPLSTDGTPGGPWVKTGFACQAPSAVMAAQPGVTRAMVQRAFRQLHFAHPRVHVQPEGNRTLVNLPTYYQVIWPAGGYEPGEIAAVTLLGRTVRLRPTAVSYTFRFGDGATQGPTTDAGGTYPDGRVRHVYERTGSMRVSAVAVYSGEYSLAGDRWEPIDVTVPVEGEPVGVQVNQARARLEGGQR